jgi:hypothetical protein
MRGENSSSNRPCYGREQRVTFNGACPVVVSFLLESSYGWHGLCCHLVKGTAEPREMDARRAQHQAEALHTRPTHRQRQSSWRRSAIQKPGGIAAIPPRFEDRPYTRRRNHHAYPTTHPLCVCDVSGLAGYWIGPRRRQRPPQGDVSVRLTPEQRR